MMIINPLKLITMRKRENMSAAKLAEASKIGRATITRIENGKTASSNSHTVESLAKALRCKPSDLGSPPEQEEQISAFFSDRVKLELKVSGASQNALELMALRYGESRETIIELAPLLFDLFARECLQTRSKILAELHALRADIGAMADRFPHFSGRLTSDWDAEEADRREERSIERRDLRGEYAHSEGLLDDHFCPDDYDEERNNPFVTHLRQRYTELVRDAVELPTIEDWPRWRSPSYELGLPEARAIAGGDDDLVFSIIQGDLRIADIPDDMWASDRLGDRQAWMRAQVAERRRKVDDQLAKHGFDLSDLLG